MEPKEKPSERINKIEQLRQCHIELEGNRELVIDGCKGIMEYSDEKIKICTDTTVVGITGDRLNIKTYTLDQIVISGKILSLDFS
ncbi:MAG: YabP/YqfC family sporulation protein [Clostridiales bacterium]|nr:YabP/YqfC family sporulation protein [Clostridiales bacterium]